MAVHSRAIVLAHLFDNGRSTGAINIIITKQANRTRGFNIICYQTDSPVCIFQHKRVRKSISEAGFKKLIKTVLSDPLPDDMAAEARRHLRYRGQPLRPALCFVRIQH